MMMMKTYLNILIKLLLFFSRSQRSLYLVVFKHVEEAKLILVAVKIDFIKSIFLLKDLYHSLSTPKAWTHVFRIITNASFRKVFVDFNKWLRQQFISGSIWVIFSYPVTRILLRNTFCNVAVDYELVAIWRCLFHRIVFHYLPLHWYMNICKWLYIKGIFVSHFEPCLFLQN